MFDDLIPQKTERSPYADAIGGIESSRRYDAIGPQTGKGRALGYYQVMDFNVGPWSKEILGREVTPGEFIRSPEIQDAIFNGKFGSYVSKYGPEGAAKAWFAGEEGMKNPNARDVLGTTVAQYANKFNRAVGPSEASSQSRPAAPKPALSFDDLIPAAPEPPPQFSDRFAGMQQPAGNVGALQSGLRDQAMSMAGQQPAPVGSQQLTDFQNQGAAAAQGTTPNIRAQMGNLISDQVYEGDSGFASFKDPMTGQIVEAQDNKHVILRDPVDGKLKVFARSADTDENKLVSASRILAPGLAAGAPTSRAMIPVANAVKARVPSTGELKSAAKEGFESFRTSGVEVPAAQVKNLSQSISAELNADGFLDVLAPKTFAVLQKLDNGPDDAVMTAAQMHAFRRAVGKIAGSVDETERAAAMAVRERFDDFLGTLPQTEETLRPALGNYAAAKRSEQVGGALDRAKMQAESTGSGANIDNAMRQQFKSMINAPKKTRGWTAEEIDAAKDIVRGDATTNAARYVGKLAPTGAVSGVISGGTGFVLGGGAGAVGLPVAGYAGKALADTLTAGKVQKLDELIRSRSPLAKQMESAINDWAGKVNDLADVPSAPKVAQVVLATKNLVNNLRDAGIVVSPSEFIKSLQGPMRGRSEDEQPKPVGVIDQ